MKARLLALAVALAVLSCSQASGYSLGFEQLSWIGTATSTPNSSWGRASLEYTGSPGSAYFNLSVNGNWVVQNMSLGSLEGAGNTCSVTTFFDLGVPHGTPVTTLDYVASIDLDPLASMPSGSSVTAAVTGIDYQIGGEDGIDLGSPGPVDKGPGSKANVTAEGKLKDFGKFKNQEQKTNECAPGAVSNSLKYLEARGAISGLPNGIGDVKGWPGWGWTSKDGTPSDWYLDKKKYLEKKNMTVRFVEGPMTAAKWTDILRQLNDGQDIEVDLVGHVETLVGVRVKDDGSVDLDLFDDNQKGDGADKYHTSSLDKGKIDGMVFERFVVQCPTPEPAGFLLAGLGLSAVVAVRRKR